MLAVSHGRIRVPVLLGRTCGEYAERLALVALSVSFRTMRLCAGTCCGQRGEPPQRFCETVRWRGQMRTKRPFSA